MRESSRQPKRGDTVKVREFTATYSGLSGNGDSGLAWLIAEGIGPSVRVPLNSITVLEPDWERGNAVESHKDMTALPAGTVIRAGGGGLYHRLAKNDTGAEWQLIGTPDDAYQFVSLDFKSPVTIEVLP